MSADRQHLIDVCRQIAADMAADTERREGLPLTGRNVAVALGELSATVAALALVVAQMNEETAR